MLILVRNNGVNTPRKSDDQRAKYVTLVLLLLWVAGVFIFTVLKFAKVV
ncbi:MAG: hypothetical protein ACK45Y_08925 [Betaproteobacteria bacterium]